MTPESTNALRLRLIDQLLHLPPCGLVEVEKFLSRLQAAGENAASPLLDSSASEPQRKLDWPHAPLHRLSDRGTFIVTAGTYHKEHFFRAPDRRDHLQEKLLALAKECGWQLEAWAVFSNHYHFVAHALAGAADLGELLKRLHGETSGHVNRLDQAEGREVWFNFWETVLTFEASYLARLSYVHRNPVKHGLVPVARNYPWCSAGWFERTATPAQVKVLARFKTDKIHIIDDFDPV
jgi:putative transposase